MRRPTALRFLVILPLLVACKTGAVKQEVSALIVGPTAESRAELRQVVSSMLGDREVTLADDALTTQSMLVVGPQNLTGRDLDKPDQFRLLLSGAECVLVHLGSNARSELTKANCAAE
jgi:hypothetical protein